MQINLNQKNQKNIYKCYMKKEIELYYKYKKEKNYNKK